jgi:hypothetical protein
MVGGHQRTLNQNADDKPSYTDDKQSHRSFSSAVERQTPSNQELMSNSEERTG